MRLRRRRGASTGVPRAAPDPRHLDFDPIMRWLPRLVVVTSSVLLLAVAATSAAPHHNKGLTINATPNAVFAGEAVLVYGQLNGPSPGHQPILLFHRARPGATSPVLISVSLPELSSLPPAT
jgi:hypothetical protein